MQNIFWRQLSRLQLAVAVISFLIQPGRGETSSLLIGSTVTSTGLHAQSSALANLIDGSSYKAYVRTDDLIGPPIAGYLDYSKWFRIDLGSPKNVVTVNIVDYATSFAQQQTFGETYICVGDDPLEP